MSEERVLVTVELEGRVDAALAEQVKTAAGAETRAIEKHGLEGQVETWLLIGNFVVSSLATLVPVFVAALQSRRVRVLKVGEVIVENPGEEEIQRALGEGGTGRHGPA